MRRFWSKVTRTEGCWIWDASRSRTGYGRFGFEGKVRKAHRVAYELVVGPIPDGLHVLHSCDNPSCVRPDHLHIGTHAENMREKVARGRDFHASKTHCSSGHLFDEANTYITPDGRRNCRACRAQAKRDFRARQRKAA